ncbi:hypothetical protein IQ254_30660, partial [Nodosilinea sp. LEGE 07088]|uniref:hypothetical protein n=1 Tax=Nodosilinea sp. LEGE 07088 TaxID=2777968 RepID=UPI001881D90D
MPFTLNGIGTTYYGKRDCTADGSYVTTEWMVFLYLPVLPIGSYRVMPTEQGANLIFYYSTKYTVKQVPLCWPQVRSGYIVTGSILGVLMAPLVGPAIATIPLSSLMIAILLLYAIAFFLFLKPQKIPKTPSAPPTNVTVDCQPYQVLPRGRGDGEQRSGGDSSKKAHKKRNLPALA